MKDYVVDIFFSLVKMHPYLDVFDLNGLICIRYRNGSINASAKNLLAEQLVKLCLGLMGYKNGWKVAPLPSAWYSSN